MAVSTSFGSAWGQLGGSALAQQQGFLPGQVFATNGTDNVNVWMNTGNYGTTTVTSTDAWNIGALGQAWQERLEPAKKKAMTLLESLRDEVGKWHGSLGVL